MRSFSRVFNVLAGPHEAEFSSRRAGEYRLGRIVELFGQVVIRVETSQHTRGFFEKYGFETKATKVDGFGPGIDYVLLTRNG